MTWIQKILALLQFAPAILQLILEIEKVVGPGQGPLKKSIVMASIDNAPAEIVPEIGNLVDKHVAALNQAGVFKKAT